MCHVMHYAQHENVGKPYNNQIVKVLTMDWNLLA
jgi:hypothetical protein